MRVRCSLSILAVILLPIVSWADVHTAASCSYTDVNNELTALVDGDILIIPSGSSTWSSTLRVTKAIRLQGAGNTATVITANAGTTQLIDLAPGSNKAIQITGIGFISGKPIHISGSYTGSYCLDNIRIDHCAFTDGMDNIFTEGWVEGLIDHNTFLNCNRAILVFCDDNRSWGRPIEAGTSHAIFIEDNTFKMTNAGGGALNENVYHSYGARTVIRYNDFDGTGYTNFDYCIFDSHGNQMGYYKDFNWYRGQPIIEVYNNTFRYHHSYRVCNIRGGSLLFYDNSFTYVGGYSTEIVVTEEEGYKANCIPNRVAWPAEDQVMNSFFWNNTRNGSVLTDITLYGVTDAVFIQKDRDYFMHAPASSGGKEVYTGRPGASNTAPTNGGSDTMTFSASGANAYYPYTPFTYPHPLQAAGGNAPEAPAKLRIK